MTYKEFLTKYDNRETFSTKELRDLFYGDTETDEDDSLIEIDYITYEPDDWSYKAENIVRINGRYFSFSAWLGNTECQDNEYDIQPQEVEPVQVTVTQWRDKK